MATATDKSQFDYITFRKCARLFDSPIEGERYAALNTALKLCGQHIPPLLFSEAVVMAFGGTKKECDALGQKISVLEAEKTDLQARLAQRDAQAAELANKVLIATRVIEQLQAKHEKEERRGNHDFRQLLNDLWDMPQIRLLLVLFLAIVQQIVVATFPDYNTASGPQIFNFVLGISQIYLFCKWVALQYKLDGPLQMLIKLFLFFGAPSIALCFMIAYFRSADVMSYSHRPMTLLALMSVFTIVTISRLSEWLVEDLGMRIWNSNPLRILRRCF